MNIRRAAILTLSLVLFALPAAHAATSAPTTAATPPMGWNSWNHFAGRVTDADVRAAADAIVSSGMKDAGYTYVNIDDTWEGKRDAKGVIHSNDKFPDMKALADYVHSKGLKLGIYSSPGPQTCARFEGSLNHEDQDAATYAAWGIDYLKYDLCSYRDIMAKDHPDDKRAQYDMMRAAYEKMHQALLKTGRPIVFSFCQYGWDDVWTWGASAGGNLWRTTNDIKDNYLSMSQIGFSQVGIARYAGPGHWNDPDMLEVGNGGMTDGEYRMHFTLWSMLAAPLLAGNDLSRMSPSALAILTNRDVIAIDQDALGRQATRAWVNDSTELWMRPLASGATAIALFNRTTSPVTVDVPLAALGLSGTLHAHDLWSRKSSDVNETLHTTIPGHDVVTLRLNP